MSGRNNSLIPQFAINKFWWLLTYNRCSKLNKNSPLWGGGRGSMKDNKIRRREKKLFRFSFLFSHFLQYPFSSMWYKRWVKGGIFPSELWPLGVAPLSSSYLKQQEEDLDCGCKIVLMLWPCLNLSAPELSQTRPGFNDTYKKSEFWKIFWQNPKILSPPICKEKL